MRGGGVLILAGGGLLAYYLYTKYGSGILGGGNVTPVTGGTLPVTGGATPPGSASTAPAFNSLAAIYSRMAAKDGTKLFTPYQWNYELGQQFSGAQPDTLDGITDWTVPISLNSYWSAASAWLHANAGLSGLRGLAGGMWAV